MEKNKRRKFIQNENGNYTVLNANEFDNEEMIDLSRTFTNGVENINKSNSNYAEFVPNNNFLKLNKTM